MKKDILFTVPSYFRDDMNIMGYRFGKGEKSCVVLGALRGDEVQQLYVCARLVAFLREVADCFIEVESLISEEYLQSNSKAEQRSKVLKFYKMKDKHKNDFWKDLFVVDKKHFQDFKALFDQVERIFNIKIETPQK